MDLHNRERNMLNVLIIIPAYNEGKNLPELIGIMRSKCSGYDFIVINDCSTDNTAQICKSLACRHINLSAKLGIGGSVQTGIKYAFINGYDIVIQVDGDGQHDPSYINLMIEKIRNGANVCIGSRFLEKEGFQSTRIRRFGICFFSGVLKGLTGEKFSDPTSGFRAWDKNAIEYFSKDYPKDYPEVETIIMLVRRGMRIEEVPVIMSQREHGRSSITFIRSIYYIFKVTISLLILKISVKE